MPMDKRPDTNRSDAPADVHRCERVGGFFGQKLERRNLKREAAAVSEEGQQAPLFSSNTWVLTKNSLTMARVRGNTCRLTESSCHVGLSVVQHLSDERKSSSHPDGTRRVPRVSSTAAPQRSSDKSRPHNQLKNWSGWWWTTTTN